MASKPLTAWRRRHRRRSTENTLLPTLLGGAVVDPTVSDTNAPDSSVVAPRALVPAGALVPTQMPGPTQVPGPTRTPERGVTSAAGPDWTGEMLLHLHDAGSRAAGTAVLVLGRDTVRIWLGDREVAVLVRDHLRAWFYQEHPDPYGGYGLFWSFENGQVCLRPGAEFFTICSDCLRALETVL